MAGQLAGLNTGDRILVGFRQPRSYCPSEESCRVGASYNAIGVDYSKLPQFAKYDLENGWLLDVREGDSFEFTVDAALTYAHPMHQRTLLTKIRDAWIRDLPPYQSTPTWVRILIVFPKVRSAQWIKKTMRPNVDPDGTTDYGSIEEFTVEGEKSHLSGSWGEIEIVSDPVEVSEIDTS